MRDALPHRQLFVCAPAQRAAITTLIQQHLQHQTALRALWVGVQPPENFPACELSQYRQFLGRELELVVIDIAAGLDPDALAALSGCLCAGGILLLLLPCAELWQLPLWEDPQAGRVCVYPVAARDSSRHFLTRLAHHLQQRIVQWAVAEQFVEVLAALKSQAAPSVLSLNAEQQTLFMHGVQALQKGHDTCLLLSADRGRGKSTTLAFIAAALLEQGYSVCLSAPRKRAVATLYQHLPAHLELPFVAPDALAADAQAWQVILLDEAAGIALPLLAQIAQQPAALLLSSTVHGYEGAGRGFAIRFAHILSHAQRPYTRHSLSTPVRWAEEDPLEHWIERTFLLRPNLPDVIDEQDGARVRALSRAQLMQDEAMLQQIYGLLLEAHYQTRPMDLRQLLDGPNLKLFVLQRGTSLLGVAMVAEEGGFESELQRAIAEGTRRPAGHLLPQLLAQQAGHAFALRDRYWRIVRIAVHPQYQRRGYGSQLLESLREQCPYAWLGASFGATVETLRFWQRAHYQLVYLGAKRNASSGCYSATVLYPCDGASRAQLPHYRQTLANRLPLWRGDSHQIDESLYAQLCAGLPERSQICCTTDQQQLLAFVQGRQGYEQSIHALHVFWRAQNDIPDWVAQKLFCAEPWREMAKKCGLGGRQAVENALRQVTQRALERQ